MNKGLIIDLNDMTDSREAMESKEPKAMKIILYLICFIITAFLLFCYFFKIDEYVEIRGVVVEKEPVSNVIIMNSSTKIAEINVAEGTQVKKGDILFRMDTVVEEKQLETLQTNIEKKKRDIDNYNRFLESVQLQNNLFVLGDDFFYKYQQYELSLEQSIKDVKIDNDKITNSKKELLKNSSILSNNIDKKNTEIKQYNKLINAVQNDNKFSSANNTIQAYYDRYIIDYSKAKNEVKLCEDYHKELTKKREGEKSNISKEDISSALEKIKIAKKNRDAVKVEFLKNINIIIDTLDKEKGYLENDKEKIDLSINNVLSENNATIMELSIKTNKIVELYDIISGLQVDYEALMQQYEELSLLIESSTYRASCDGIVNFFNKANIGDSVALGTQMMVIVPDTELMVELYIDETAKAKIKEGQSLKYLFEAAPYQQYGTLRGNVEKISGTVVKTEAINCYIGEATLGENILISKVDDKIVKLSSGMSVDVRAVLGKKRILHWLLEKINYM